MDRCVYLPSLTAQVDVPNNGILSRTVYEDAFLKVVLFGFDTGQLLSEHTASVPAIIEILEGEAELRLGDEVVQAGPGAWASMEANLPHAVIAKTPLKMALTMLHGAKSGA
jgi:quercetin dioxygenase-like cupin family protein